ncbi:hypothetical protein WA158_006529 [Blastocystis sp. Blastoise]
MQPIFLRRALTPLANQIKVVAMRKTPSVMEKPLTYLEEQYARGRFVSPHISIYKNHWATLSSGCHRLTGLGLWLGFVTIGCAAACTVNVDNCINWCRLHPMINYPFKFFLTYAFGYHVVCGTRHLFFDFYPEKLTWKNIQTSSICIIWGMAVVALLAACLKLKPLEDKKKN